MLFCLYAAIIICIVVVQTVVMPSFPLFDSFYDILLSFIIFIGLFRSPREGLPVALMCGFLLDGLSGAGVGFYTTTYVWVYICCIWAIRFFHAENSFIFLFAVAAGVIGQNLIFLGSFLITGSDTRMQGSVLSSFHSQVIYAFITGPFLLAGFKQIFKLLDKYKHRDVP